MCAINVQIEEKFSYDFNPGFKGIKPYVSRTPGFESF